MEEQKEKLSVEDRLSRLEYKVKTLDRLVYKLFDYIKRPEARA